MMLREKKKHFDRTLFRWHKTHYRPMAWRNTHDPYKILVSEIMLQQTQVDRVRKKYDEFLKKFPTVQALARAHLGDVLRVWSGLGYNRRAKYLHESAKKIVREYKGKFPHETEELRKLPGIGISTAAAIRAFAFAADEPMIDTNIRRILVRVFFSAKRPKAASGISVVPPSDSELFAFARSLIPKGRGRAWNYAMLDLGASVCTARNHSLECPLATLHGVVEDFRYKKPQKPFKNSTRYYRGKIMVMVTHAHGPLSVRYLKKQLGLSGENIQKLLKGLINEHLIVKKGLTIRTPR